MGRPVAGTAAGERSRVSQWRCRIVACRIAACPDGGYGRLSLERCSGIARAQAVDLIALATHRRSGVTRWLLGGVADKVVRGATLPVLLYRPQSEASADELSLG